MVNLIGQSGASDLLTTEAGIPSVNLMFSHNTVHRSSNALLERKTRKRALFPLLSLFPRLSLFPQLCHFPQLRSTLKSFSTLFNPSCAEMMLQPPHVFSMFSLARSDIGPSYSCRASVRLPVRLASKLSFRFNSALDRSRASVSATFTPTLANGVIRWAASPRRVTPRRGDHFKPTGSVYSGLGISPSRASTAITRLRSS